MDLPAGTGAAAWLTGLLADTVLWGATLQHTLSAARYTDQP
jgi:hypothetical protein